MTVLNTGSTEKYSDGWDKVFGNRRRASKATSKRTAGSALQKKMTIPKASTKKKVRGKKKASARSTSRRR